MVFPELGVMFRVRSWPRSWQDWVSARLRTPIQVGAYGIPIDAGTWILMRSFIFKGAEAIRELKLRLKR
jgi:hypothetical protein